MEVSAGAGADRRVDRVHLIRERESRSLISLRVPRIRLEREPHVHWDTQLMSYELRDAIVACDRV